jgi:selenocysteine lyase/cysteine desulfurase
MAITRNASESLQISLNGIDLQPGDEVLTTTQDYPRMINTIKQRALREGVVLKQIKLPTPAQSQAELYDLFEEALTPKTRAILVSHVINITGQIMPVRRICELARKRGIWSIVDGAHAFAQIVYNGGEIGCDMYGVSLHKWLMAPIGTGLLYVRKGRIKDLWPLTAPADAKSADIRKFEEIGTHSDAPRLAIAEALTFHEGIGPARKEARLRYLRDYWAQRVLTLPKARLHTNLAAEHSCAIGTLQLDGIDTIDLTQHLWNKHRIIVSPIKHDEFQGIRVTPNVFTTLDELDLFVNAIEDAAAKGLPAANIEKPK